MKAGEPIDLLMLYDEDGEVQIEIYETLSNNYIHTTAAITIVEENVYTPTLRIDVEAGKFKALHQDEHGRWALLGIQVQENVRTSFALFLV